MRTVIDQAKQLIAIPSTADNPTALKEAVAYVAGMVAQTPGITIEHFMHEGKPSFLAFAGDARPDNFTVLLNAHVDVVPGKPEQFNAVEKNGALYGRGALDMKVAALLLTRVFCELAAYVPYALGLQIVSDEEVGGHAGTAYQLEQGVRAGFVIAGEYTHKGQICIASRGICQIRVHIAGETAHSAYPWNGKNAAAKAAQLVQDVLAAYPLPATEEWKTTISVAGIQSGTDVYNAIPDSATVMLDCRYVPGDPNFTSRRTAEKFIKQFVPEGRIAFALFEPAHSADEQHPTLKALAQALEHVTGQATHYIRKPGGADVRFYSARGVPAVVFGVDGEHIHGDNECAYSSSFTSYYQALRHFLRHIPLP